MTQRPLPFSDNPSDPQARALTRLLRELVDQRRATVAIAAHQPADGFWFGAGNAQQDDQGDIWLVGRYRDVGDSRTGLEAGVRGAELALFRSSDGARSFTKERAWYKRDLALGAEVTSIEGSALARRHDGGWELYVSTEKLVPYPAGLESLQKPGTGVWSIDRFRGHDPASLDVSTLEPVLASDDPATLHVKDPVVAADRERTHLWACTHPATWASSNTIHTLRASDDAPFALQRAQAFARGALWDVAVTRLTHRQRIPRLGLFADGDYELLLYDGAESMRALEANPRAADRPRGYSCEELGGAMWGRVGDPHPRRLSQLAPLFVSPQGTGCSRYLSILVTEDDWVAFWQQGQADGSQPLVTHRLPHHRVHELLSQA